MDRYDLHVHTAAGKGTGSVREAALAAKAIGLAGICIMDAPMDSVTCREAQEETGITILLGQEIEAIEGRVLGIGLKTAVEDGKNILDTIIAIERQGGIAVPTRPLRLITGVGPALLAKLPVNHVEGRNGRDRKLVQENTMNLADKLGLATIGGSDNRSLDQIGVAYTMLEGDPMEALRAGAVGAGGDSFKRRNKWTASIKARFQK